MIHRAAGSLSISPKNIPKRTNNVVMSLPEAKKSHTQAKQFCNSDEDMLSSRAGGNSLAEQKSRKCYITDHIPFHDINQTLMMTRSLVSTLCVTAAAERQPQYMQVGRVQITDSPTVLLYLYWAKACTRLAKQSVVAGKTVSNSNSTYPRKDSPCSRRRRRIYLGMWVISAGGALSHSTERLIHIIEMTSAQLNRGEEGYKEGRRLRGKPMAISPLRFSKFWVEKHDGLHPRYSTVNRHQWLKCEV